MSAILELEEKRSLTLQEVARRRKVSPKRLLGKAVDDFLQRLEDEELLENSARTAQQTGLREEDAVEIVREWRRKNRNGG